jgi:hypothetical protein
MELLINRTFLSSELNWYVRGHKNMIIKDISIYILSFEYFSKWLLYFSIKKQKDLANELWEWIADEIE